MNQSRWRILIQIECPAMAWLALAIEETVVDQVYSILRRLRLALKIFFNPSCSNSIDFVCFSSMIRTCSLKIFFSYHLGLNQKHLIQEEAVGKLVQTTSKESLANSPYFYYASSLGVSSASTDSFASAAGSRFIFFAGTSFQRTQTTFANHKGQT